MKTAEEKWPELAKEAAYIDLCTLNMIHKAKSRILKSKPGTDCPYPAQCILEMVIAKLEKCV